VFSVELDETSGKLKLPYNITEDPWHAAQKFIHKHNLSQMFLDQIANFIVTNTKGMTLGSQSNQAQDPFTGANRYIPGSSVPAGLPTQGQDPFTGGSRYVPQGGVASSSASSSLLTTTNHIPQKEYVLFNQANVSALRDKLSELNQVISGDCDHKLSDTELEIVVMLAENNALPNAQAIEVLKKLLRWPHETIFPCLDILRLAIRNQQIFTALCPEVEAFASFVLQFFTTEGTGAVQSRNQFLILRALANIMSYDKGRDFMFHCYDQIIPHMITLLPSNVKNLEIAAATVLLNYSIAFCNIGSCEQKIQFMSAVTTLVEKLNDHEAFYRALVALGNLLYNDQEAINLCVSLGIKDFIIKVDSSNAIDKVKECSKVILAIVG